MQTYFPFVPFTRVPLEHVELLRLANAGLFPAKEEWFYPFKARFLQAYALPDGWDAQEVQRHCWMCSGIGRHEWRGDECRICDGAGVYRSHTVYLRRWNIHDHVFHTPVPAGELPVSPEKFKHRFVGLIRHEEVDGEVAEQAFLRLLEAYDPAAWQQIGKMYNGTLEPNLLTTEQMVAQLHERARMFAMEFTKSINNKQHAGMCEL